MGKLFQVLLDAKLNESSKVVFLKKFDKDGVKYTLWQKGDYWYELTLSSQEGQGFKHIDEWHKKSLEEIEADLKKKGYKPV